MSFYSNTNDRDFYLDLWIDPGLGFSPSDPKKSIPVEYDLRPDLMANKEYGSSRFWWVFALRNKDILIDPVEDFKAGTEIHVPNMRALSSIGGN
jgi:hypothetical protein